MRFVFVSLILIVLALAGCGPKAATLPAQTPVQASRLPDLGKAPELTNDVWLNTAAPVRLADLRGKVVLIDMWTFG